MRPLDFHWLIDQSGHFDAGEAKVDCTARSAAVRYVLAVARNGRPRCPGIAVMALVAMVAGRFGARKPASDQARGGWPPAD